jgi:hypothetical protein
VILMDQLHHLRRGKTRTDRHHRAPHTGHQLTHNQPDKEGSRQFGVGKGATLVGRHNKGISKKRIGGSLLMSLVASGALAVGSLSSAGPANATCVDVGKLDIGKGCSVTGSGDIAIALGRGATATDNGTGDMAFAIGRGATATDVGNGNIVIAEGERAEAVADRDATNSTAIARGRSSLALVGSGSNNSAIAIGARSFAKAGVRSNNNVARVTGDNSTALAFGGDSTAEVIGNDSRAEAGGPDTNVGHDKAFVFGNHSSAKLHGVSNQTLRVNGDHVHKP